MLFRAMRNPEPLPARGCCEGVRNVVRFNWPMIGAGALTGVAGLVLSGLIRRPRWLRLFAGAVGAGASWQTLASLTATHLAYDRSQLYAWSWLESLLPARPRRIANIHSGFDESSVSLRALFPEAELRVFDFYDPSTHTEPSIARARALCPPAIPAQSFQPDSLPLADASQDLVVLFLSAHEIRDRSGRVQLLSECARSLAEGGRLILVEHLRDLPNFIAYGPGALHFHSRREWLLAISRAGLNVCVEQRISPFIRVFACCHSS